MTKTERNFQIGSRATEQSKEKLEDEYSDGMAARISDKSWPACAMFEVNFFTNELKLESDRCCWLLKYSW